MGFLLAAKSNDTIRSEIYIYMFYAFLVMVEIDIFNPLSDERRSRKVGKRADRV